MNRGTTVSDIDDGTSKESETIGGGVSAESVRSHLEKVASSSVFAPSQRLVRFLQYVTERSLEGQADELKEFTIGLEVFDRDSSYDPRIDTIVRSEARRLRSKLKQYYDTEGRFDTIAIDLPKGRYAPAFRKRNLAVEGERAGTIIGRYQVGERIGSGATSVVYKAEDTRLKRTVALKFLAPQLVSDEATKARLIREAQAAATLDHPNICTVFEIDEADGQTFIALGYVDGENLDNRIANEPLEIRDAIEIARQICGALAQAHRKGVVHRDLKPSNVMLEREGLVKVVDFGLAQVAGRSRLTREGVTVGTVAYLAPEQIQRQESDERSDIWSLGVVLYEMITGRSPFEGERDEATLYAILHEEPTPISQLCPEAPPAFQRVVAKALEKWPSQRHQHAAEFLKDLNAIVDGGAAEVSSEEPSAAPEQPTEPSVLRKPIALSSAVLMTIAAVVIAATLVWLVHPGSQPTRPATYQITQLTRDSGLSYQPSLSGDGKLMAYASDRAAEGNLDIWVQQVPRGNPIRLTRNEADDHDPHFSLDGTTVVFRSERDGGGVYTVPALGGEERILAKLGRRPRFSPDGREVAYWTGESPFVFSLSHIYIVKATGGQPRRFQPDFDWVSHPVWSPDGRRILFSGSKAGVFAGGPRPLREVWRHQPADWAWFFRKVKT